MGWCIFAPIRNLFRRWHSNKSLRILVLGLDDSGKTTMLYSLGLGEIVTTIPTIAFFVETLEYRSVQITSWDLGGCNHVMPIRKEYMKDKNGIIFVIDSNDRDRIVEAREELHRLLQNETLQGLPLLVFANKQDLPNAISTSQLKYYLKLSSLTERQWTIQSCSFISKDGVSAGLDWLTRAIFSFKKDIQSDPVIQEKSLDSEKL